MNNLAAEEMPSLGKYDLIAELAKGFVQENASTVMGIGDDAAVIAPSSEYVVSSSKVFMENVHFDLTYVPLQYLGYKVVTVVCSDLLAMNAIPTQLSLNVAISNRFDLKAVQDLLDGVATGCENLHVDITGLDITTSRRDMIISASAIGECEPAQLVKRQGAQDNELLCVSGDFAAAYAGLLLLEREKKVFDANPTAQPDFGGQDYLLRRQLRPEARLDIIEALRRENIVPTSMVNVCDGMAAALMQICHASNKGAILFEERIPMTELTFNTLKSFDIVHTVAALNGGDDYELMFTIKQSDFENIKNVQNVSIVGYIKEKEYGCQLLTSDNHQIEIKAQGFSKIQHNA
ncbi:MAG: thiamine-phosphate kinase [Bacteroidales bacterium]|nr:thiamine-phosphate kinase [Bacteroidales bacterium]